MKQFMRDVTTGQLTLEYFAKKFADGWKIASIDWVRETSDATETAESLRVFSEEGLPFGLRLSGNGMIEESPLEASVLLLILEQIIREKRIQEIATELNAQGFVTREGAPWTPTAVFNLMPRLIEAGPTLLKSTAWKQRRPPTGTTSPSKAN